MARAFGSYPKGRGFDPLHRYQPNFYNGGRGEGVNAPDCGSGIRGFESHRSPHFFVQIAVVVELADTPS